MKKLYKIIVQHVAPKDEHTSVECFLLAEDDEAVYNWLDEKKTFGMWSDWNDDGVVNKNYEWVGEDYNLVSEEGYREYITRIRGDYFDEDQDYDDAYYGLTFYGWEEMAIPNVTMAEAVLDPLGILERA